MLILLGERRNPTFSSYLFAISSFFVEDALTLIKVSVRDCVAMKVVYLIHQSGGKL